MPYSENISKSFESVPKLLGKENFVIWTQRITLSLSLTGTIQYVSPAAAPPYSLSGASPLTAEQQLANNVWDERDAQVAAGILSTCEESILAAHIHLLERTTGRASTVYLELATLYGTSGAQYSFALGRKFVDSRCEEGADVEAWVNGVLAQHRELKLLRFDLDLLCVNVLLNGLPERFGSYVDQVWTANENPSIEDIRVAILRINAGQQNRSSDARALAAELDKATLSSDLELSAFYTGLKRTGRKPSKEHPCARCGSPTHWVIDCSKPASDFNRSFKRRGNKNRRDKSSPHTEEHQAVPAKEETANFAAHAYDNFAKGEVAHALLSGSELSALATTHTRDWILDSGASVHMTGHKDWLEDMKPLSTPVQVTVASGATLPATEEGSTRLLNHKGEVVRITGIVHVPNLAFNLLSVHDLVARGAHVEFGSRNGSTSSCVFKNGVEVLLATPKYKAWVVETSHARMPDILGRMAHALPAQIEPQPNGCPPFRRSSTKAPLNVWHRRLAHLGYDSLQLLLSSLSTGASIARSVNPVNRACEGCVMGKITRPPFPQSDSRADMVLQLVHTDLCEMGTTSEAGARYAMVLVDDFSRYTWVFFLNRKSDALEKFKDWLPRVERSLDRKLKTLRSDGGGEFTSNNFERFLSTLGIAHQTTVSYTSQQNGVAERANRTLVERTISLMHSERLPVSLWAEVMNTVVYVKNRSPSRSIQRSTPYALVYNKRPDLSHLRVVGCVAYVLVLKKKRISKLADRARLCMFLGYSETQKAWRVWDVQRREVVVSRDIIFDESRRPEELGRTGHVINNLKNALTPPLHKTQGVDLQVQASNALREMPDRTFEFTEAVGDEGVLDTGETVGAEGDRQVEEAVEAGEAYDHLPEPRRQVRRQRNKRVTWVYEDELPPCEPEPEDPNLVRTRSGRVSRIPQRLALASQESNRYEDELDDFLGRPGVPDCHPSDPRLYDFAAALNPHVLATQAAATLEPASWTEAMKTGEAAEWTRACDEELASLRSCKVFTAVPRSSIKGRILTSKWVLKVKKLADGSIERFKARIVARGFMQVEGVDYNETFAPVAKFQSIRLILALTAQHDLELHQMDVKTAFLYGTLDEEVYMEQPEGYSQNRALVWKLNKSLYGLKQASRAWYRELDATLLVLGFVRTISDHSIYVRDDSHGLIIVGVYVDDLTIAARRLDTLTRFKEEMAKRYSMKDLGELHFILGLQVVRDRKKHLLQLSQQSYILSLLTRFGYDTCRPAKSPLPAKTVLTARAPDEPATDRTKYLTAIGSLMYAMLGTRPDIAFAIGLLARFNQDPSETHWNAVVHILRYLSHTRNTGIVYGPASQQLEGFSDADFATSDTERRRVTSGYVFRLWGGAISWQSKRQPSVSLATGDAEYVAISQAARELMWLRSILYELGFKPHGPTTLYGDNQAAIAIAKNPVAHSRSKQIDIRYHYVRELVERQVIDLRYTPTAAMVADGFTKALPPVQLATLLKSLGLQTTGTERHAMASEHAMVAVITPHDCNSGKTYAHLVATAPSIAATLTSEITCYDCYDHL